MPEELASDPDRLERFRREARALAAIDHPSIVTIHSAGLSSGKERERLYLRAAEYFDKAERAGALPRAYATMADKARRYSRGR